MIKNKDIDYNLNNLIEKSIHDLHKYKKYKVILMNSIQYQCSLGCNPKKYRDHNWIQYWFSQGKEEFLERLQIYNQQRQKANS